MDLAEHQELPSTSSIARRVAVGTQRRRWQRSTERWEEHAVSGLTAVIDAVVAEAGPTNGRTVVDVGAGGGAVALRMAPDAERVIAVDVSARMLERLSQGAEEQGFDHVESTLGPIEGLELPPESVDLVVSNYALHHLLDRDKERFVQAAASWLRPGGKLVIGDMMLGRGWSRDDRRIVRSKVVTLMGRGPAGWWRVAKNAWRLMSRTVERPLPMDSWTALLRHAGFSDVTGRRVVAEAGVVSGRRS